MLFKVYVRNNNRPGRPVTETYIESSTADEAYDAVSATLEDGCNVTAVYKAYQYYYGMRLRGFSPGCQPKEGLMTIQEDPNGKYWDVLIYDRKLTNEEVRDYELDFIKENKI